MVHIERWRSSRRRAAFERLATPLIWALNRPSMAAAGRLLFELALRCNGIGNNAVGPSGLTQGEERFLRRLLPGLGEGVIVDVGANVGSFASFVRLHAPEARIIAFEPHPLTVRTLAAIAEQRRFEVVNRALSDVRGAITLYDFPDDDGSTQASLDPEVIRFHGGKAPISHEVPVTTLDDFAEEQGIETIAFLKIDTEGFDLNVLRGARNLLSSQRIQYIQFEFIGSNIVRRVAMRDFFELFEEYGYAISRICLNGSLLSLHPYSPKFHEIYARHNLVAQPRKALPSSVT